MEESSWRRHHVKVIMEGSWRSHHGGVIKEESSWRSHHGGVIIEESSWRRHHGLGDIWPSWRRHHGGGIIGGIMEEASWRSHHGGVIMEESSWSMEEVSWRSLGALWGLSGSSAGSQKAGVAMGFWRPKVSKFIVFMHLSTRPGISRGSGEPRCHDCMFFTAL